MITDQIKIRGNLDIVIRDGNGEVKETRQERNLVVTAGLGFIASRMKDTTDDAMTHMAVGSGSTAAAAGDTDLGSILGSREVLDSTTVSGATVTYVSSFEAGDGTGAITEAGIFNAASGGTMLCRTVFSTVNKAADDTMTITWTITLSAS
jgi:hypothetical protein